MKLLIDECILGQTARLLKKKGFSIISLKDLGKTAITNGAVINIAKKKKAVIVTNDLDFANFILYPLSCHRGIIVLRPRVDTPEAIKDIHQVLIRLLKEIKPAEIEKSLIIVDRNKYRIKQ